MFGSSSPFGQSSTSPFGQTSFGAQPQQQGFGQPNAAANNPFAPKPFGSPTTAFGAQTGSSFFGNTSTGAFGQQQSTPTFGAPSSSSPFGSSTPAFGASSTPAFGASSTPAFGASSTPAFGASSSTFGSGSLFGQKPSFGAFGSSPSQSSPFGSTFQQSQPAFGSNAFGATTTPAFGATSAPAFGATTTPGFGASTTPAFGSTSTSLFGGTSTPAFGSTAFGSSASGSGFGTTGTTAFSAGSSPGFGASSTPAFGFGSSPAVGQTTTSFGSSPFGATSSPFGAQTSTFGSQPIAAPFSQASFGNQAGGTRIKPYAQTPDADSATSGSPAAKLDSISAMPEYKDKSHEELRWEDYQRGDKGGPNPSGTPTMVPQQNPQPNAFSAPSPFGQVNTNPFQSTQANNIFAKTSSPFGSTPTFNTSFSSSSATPSMFSSSTSTNVFGQTSGSVFPTSSPSLFSNTTPAFTPPSLFGTSSSNPSPFSSGSIFTSTPNQSSGLFQSSPAIVQQTSSAPAFSSSGSPFTTPSIFGSGPSPFSTPTFQQSAPQTSNMFSFQPATQPGGFTGFSNTTSQAPMLQITPNQTNMVMQPAPVQHPYGTLPTMPQMSIGNVGSSPSVQYGISSLPVAEKPLPSRTLSMVVPRHLSQRRIKLHPRKYNPISDGKVPFFADDEETTATPKADAYFIPRENPRNLIIRPIDQWPSWNGIDKRLVPKDSADLEKYKGASTETERDKAAVSPSKPFLENGSSEPADVTWRGNGASIERLLPKLPGADYFTEPSLEELAAKERAEPGYCSHVRDFIVGRRGYGSIKFLGETDVRGLDLESIVEFNNREVIVYKDDSNKPPVGKGLNKAAEVTLLNIKCVNKKTGDQYREGPRVEKYKEVLVKKAEEQGAEFVSFDAAKGEWKFRVKHFSAYGFW